MAKEIPWHSLNLKETESRLATDFDKGLTDEEVKKRQIKFGENIISVKEEFYYLKLFWKQVKSPLVFILIIAGLIALGLKEYANAIVIFLAVTINTAIGIFQEGKASKLFKKLESSQERYATVIRNNKQTVVKSSDLVPGDIIILSIGNKIPADARLIEEKGIESNEAILTGEWLPVAKDAKKAIPENAFLTDRDNMIWMGTLITEGWGKAVVVSTGFFTETGKIAKLVSTEEEMETPFQKSIEKMGRFLGIIIFISIAFIFLLGIGKGRPFSEMLFISIAVAVAAIPEGLPVAVSIVLTVGMERILSKGGLVKHLTAAETLGSTSVILSDKTGTLTKAEMQVSKIITLAPDEKNRLPVLEMALFTSEAFIENQNEELKEWIIRGNPMDKAILLASLELDLNPLDIIKNKPRFDFIPFDSERRFSASLNKNNSGSRIYLKGAPELVLTMCSHVYKDGKAIKLTEKEIKLLSHNYEIETAKGIRMLAVAYRDGNWDSFPHHQKVDGMIENMVFGGFIGFHDPLREDVIETIKTTKESKIRLVMVTGDHVVTAKRIAEEAGLIDKEGIFLDGENLEKMSDADLTGIIGKVDVFARVLPHQKLRIVRALQSKGEIVAMTGDGVNDAPALKNANIGLALGSGTEVAKEASDIILLDNSFSVIFFAIQEGRRILDNLRKIVILLFSTSFKEIILIGTTMVLGMPLPILPAQILWLNIVEDGIMNFAFAFEPKEENLITRDPKSHSSKNILSKSTKNTIYIIAVIFSIFLISLFLFLFYSGQPIEKIRTIIFAGMSFGSIFFAISLKNMKKPIWKINIFSNIYLVAASLISFIFLFGALHIPSLQKILSTVPLYFNDYLLVLSVGIFYVITIEFVKYFLFWKNKT